jgi:hypothetical protein
VLAELARRDLVPEIWLRQQIAAIEIARQQAEAIWQMLTRNRPFAPAGATALLAA